MDSPIWVYVLGLCGMGIYGSRILIQWYISEKAGKVESPGIYWVLSSLGAVILYIYGWLRKDFSILFGEIVGSSNPYTKWWFEQDPGYFQGDGSGRGCARGNGGI